MLFSLELYTPSWPDKLKVKNKGFLYLNPKQFFLIGIFFMNLPSPVRVCNIAKMCKYPKVRTRKLLLHVYQYQKAKDLPCKSKNRLLAEIGFLG